MDTVKVLSEDRIKVYLRGGLEVEQEIRTSSDSLQGSKAWYNKYREGVAGRRLAPLDYKRSNRTRWDWGGYFFFVI